MRLEIRSLVDEKFQNKNQFARTIKSSYQDALKLYNGDTSRIYFDTLERICDALDCTPNDILLRNKEE